MSVAPDEDPSSHRDEPGMSSSWLGLPEFG